MQLAILESNARTLPPRLVAALRQRRIDLGIMQNELARRIVGRDGKPVHQSSLSGWESGAVVPPPDMVAAWADALGVQVLMGLREKPGADPKA